MNEQECLSQMVAPGTRRPGKYREGVIQVWVTRACDKACFACTQGSNLGGKPGVITIPQFESALESLKGYWGVVGMFGGNPATHPHFPALCSLMRQYVRYEQRGIWSNNPMTLANAREMSRTFNPAVSNLNIHLDTEAYAMFKQGWPECSPVGLHQDSRHSPVHLAMKDVLWKTCYGCEGSGWWHEDKDNGVCPECRGSGKLYDEERAWELISNCDINKHWSAMVGVFRGQVRAWFCEVAGAQAMLHQDESDYPDTGIPIVEPTPAQRETARLHGIELNVGDVFSGHFPMNEPPVQPWWKLPMRSFADQVRKHCHECAVPLRGYGQLAMAAEGAEQTSATHAGIFKPKRKGRLVEVVTDLVQLGVGRVQTATKYLQNASL